MASLLQKLSSFARSPRGRMLARQAQEALRKPENQRKLRQLRNRLGRRR